MNRRRAWWVAVALAAGLMASGCGTSATGKRVSLHINGPSIQTTDGNVVKLAMGVSGIKIVSPNGDSSGTTGHFHVFIDRDPAPPGSVIPKDAGILHTEANPIVVTGLTDGWHRLIVVPGDGTHRRIGGAMTAVNVDVIGPSVTAAVPAAVTLGESAVVTIAVQGVKLSSADGDTSGKTGHLHLFVDRDPTPAGKPIPKGDPKIIHTEATSVSVPGLFPGPHFIWVVLGNGAHEAFEPPVEAKVTFTVE